MELEGKVAIVTGASTGIGQAYALALAGAGATVVAVARTLGRIEDGLATPESLTETIEAGRSLPGPILARDCDVGDEAALANLIDSVGSEFGHLDILVNNAAIMRSHDTFEVGGEEFDKVMRINVRAPYVAIRQAAPFMIARKSGSIVNITARAGNFVSREDGAHHNLLPYGVSKAALNRLSHFMAEELKPHGIAVNVLSPGVVRSASVVRSFPDAPGKPCTPEVLGPALLYLAGQTAETLTGQILHTDEFGKSWGVERHG